MITFSPNTLIKSADENSNFTDLSTGAGDVLANQLTQARADAFSKFVVPGGCAWTATSGLAAGMASGVVVVNGKRLTVSAIATHTFSASNDTYVDLQDNGDGTAIAVYVGASNGATTGMTLTANSVRVAKVVTNGSNVTSIKQANLGNGTANWYNTDPLGNIVYPESPNGILRYFDYTSAGVNGSASPLGATAWVFIAPRAGWVEWTFTADWTNAAAPAMAQNFFIQIDGTGIGYVAPNQYTNGKIDTVSVTGQVYCAAGSHTMQIVLTNTAATNVYNRHTNYKFTPN